MMTPFTSSIKIAAVLTLILAGSALANGNDNGNPNPPGLNKGGDSSASSSSDALAQALSAAFAGAVSGSASSSAQQQAQRQSSRNDNRSSATGGNANAQGGNQSVYVDNSNRQRMAANTAAPVILGGYGPANCFGDTNPSGQFGASMQVFGWGVAANSSKASNVCAVAALAGPAAAIGYLQRMDPNVPRPLVVEQVVNESCPAGSRWDGAGCWVDRK